jgi:hypothetical protein
VTGATGGIITPACLGSGGVTLIAGCVSLYPRGHRQRHSSIYRLMTSRARDIPVLGVGKGHVEAFQRRERPYFVTFRLHAGMANRANRAAVCGELLSVTACARGVLHRTNGPRRIGFAAMTQQARQALMTRGAMREFRKISPALLCRFRAQTRNQKRRRCRHRFDGQSGGAPTRNKMEREANASADQHRKREPASTGTTRRAGR